jgi:hypothetical protein
MDQFKAFLTGDRDRQHEAPDLRFLWALAVIVLVVILAVWLVG